jgi:crotonobetainyl-CoA:carnitine CoA-transferase CaiB-like acyl-CoA transferase
MNKLPLSGYRVVEFSQMIMGPCCGLILADLGAEVVKVEPLKGDKTRDLPEMGMGFFPTFNRNKKSVALDIDSEAGHVAARKLIASSDILIENFRPGMMASNGLDYDSLKADNPRLVYCSLKGFLPGPYENRTALDEVVQMMGGLAYLSGLPGRPMRAGASVNDIMGAMFGAIAIFAALQERAATGFGQEVRSGLYENNAFLVAQSIATEALSGKPARPWSETPRPWPVYDLFLTSDEHQVFIGVVSDSQWRSFCRAFGRDDWANDDRFRTNSDRVRHRHEIHTAFSELVRAIPLSECASRLERIGLPFAPVQRPFELLDDPHLQASDGLMDIRASNGQMLRLPGLPISMNGMRLPKRSDPPSVGEHNAEILGALGVKAADGLLAPS